MDLVERRQAFHSHEYSSCSLYTKADLDSLQTNIGRKNENLKLKDALYRTKKTTKLQDANGQTNETFQCQTGAKERMLLDRKLLTIS